MFFVIPRGVVVFEPPNTPPPPIGYAPDVPLHFAKISLRAIYAGFFFLKEMIYILMQQTVTLFPSSKEKKKRKNKQKRSVNFPDHRVGV